MCQLTNSHITCSSLQDDFVDNESSVDNRDIGSPTGLDISDRIPDSDSEGRWMQYICVYVCVDMYVCM